MYEIKDGDQVVGRFDLTPIPGCSVVAISHHLSIDPEHRGKGLGKRAQQERLAMARSMGLQLLLATVVEGNKPQERILEGSGWKRVSHFDNPKTGNRVVLWSKNLTDPYDCGFFEGHGCR